MSAPKEEMLERVSELSIHNCHTISPASEEAMKENTTQLDQSSGHRNSVNANNNNKKKKKKKTITQEKILLSQKLVETNFPWKVVNRPGRGRCAVASRNINAGEVVVAEQAVAFMPRAHYHSAICHSCCCDFTENSDRVKCSSCQNVFHCKTCEEKALLQHRKWCSVYKEINRIAKESDCDQDLVHFVLSLFSKKYSDPDNNRKVVGVESINVGGKEEGGVIKSSFQDVLGLQTHQSKMPKAWRNSVKKACQALQIVIMNECEGDLDCSVGELEWLAALVNTNAHGMGAQGLRNTDVALGIFPFVSMLNHSCRPNCCFASEGNVMFVRAIQDISTDNELCVSYINLYEPRSTRKHELSVTKHFDCNCQRCMEPLESSLDRFLEGCMCNVKGCDGVLLKSSLDGHVLGDGKLTPWICDTCSRVLDPMSFDAEGKQIAETPWVLVGKAEEQMAIAMSAYRERRLKDARALLEKFNGDFSGKLHYLHVLLFDSLTPLMNCHRAVGDAEGGVRVCRRILSCLEKVLPNSSLELANFYFCLGEMCFERAEASDISPVLAKHYKKQAHEAFQHVRQIRKICLGKSDLPNQ